MLTIVANSDREMLDDARSQVAAEAVRAGAEVGIKRDWYDAVNEVGRRSTARLIAISLSSFLPIRSCPVAGCSWPCGGGQSPYKRCGRATLVAPSRPPLPQSAVANRPYTCELYTLYIYSVQQLLQISVQCCMQVLASVAC